MLRLFISYSRVDKPFTTQLAQRLRRVYSHDNVWFDEQLHGGQKWWTQILQQIARCDVFIYLLSPESVQSAYCQAEVSEAERLHKPVLPVLIRARTEIPASLADYHYEDLSDGLTVDSFVELQRAIVGLTDRTSDDLPPLFADPVALPIDLQAVDQADTSLLARARAFIRLNLTVGSCQFYLGVTITALMVVVFGAVFVLTPTLGGARPPLDIPEIAQLPSVTPRPPDTLTPLAPPSSSPTAFVPTATIPEPGVTLAVVVVTSTPGVSFVTPTSDGQGGGVSANAFAQTATALAQVLVGNTPTAEGGVGGPITPTPTPVAVLPVTGLFDASEGISQREIEWYGLGVIALFAVMMACRVLRRRDI